jgi:hypothetical protein
MRWSSCMRWCLLCIRRCLSYCTWGDTYHTVHEVMHIIHEVMPIILCMRLCLLYTKWFPLYLKRCLLYMLPVSRLNGKATVLYPDSSKEIRTYKVTQCENTTSLVKFLFFSGICKGYGTFSLTLSTFRTVLLGKLLVWSQTELLKNKYISRWCVT